MIKQMNSKLKIDLIRNVSNVMNIIKQKATVFQDSAEH
jgi:hypothetical protein